MKKTIKWVVSVILLSIFIASCDDKTSNYDNYDSWKKENDEYFATLRASGRYEILSIPTNRGGGELLIKKLASGHPDSIPPIFNSTILCHYKGWNKNDSVFDKSFEGDQPTWDDTPATIPLANVVKGFNEMLQQMVSGDKYEVVIPWELGYGDSGSGKILPFTTLHFEVELIKVLRH